MSKDATWPLEQGLVEHLKKNPKIQSFLGNPPDIHDQCPGTAEVPYLTLGDSDAKDWSSATFEGQEHEITLHLWTGNGGSAESKKIAGAVIDVLHDADFPVIGHALVNMQFMSSETRYLEGLGRFHCRLRFKALTVSD